MKTIIIRVMLIVALIFTYFLTVCAQLKVESIGRVQVGTIPNISNVNDADNITSMQIFGKNGDFRAGSKLTFGDFGRYDFQGWNAFIGEYGTTDTDQLWLHGKNGIYITYSNGTVIAYYDVNQGNMFKFNCDLYSNGIKLTSDERLKEDIKPLKSTLSSLQKLNGVSYHLKKPKMTAPGQTKKVNNGQAPTDKEQKDIAFFEQWDNELNNSKDLRNGFLAQDLQKVYPELVTEDNDGMLSVDYLGLIPVIVESIKEQQQIIDEQSKRIDELENSVAKLMDKTVLKSSENNSFSTNTALNTVSTENSQAILYQNTPNPFSHDTQIRFNIPASVNTATLTIYDLQGKQLMQFSIAKRGEGYQTISEHHLSAGMYFYALITDGAVVDTKRMILTK
jgi:hypothetical protein